MKFKKSFAVSSLRIILSIYIFILTGAIMGAVAYGVIQRSAEKAALEDAQKPDVWVKPGVSFVLSLGQIAGFQKDITGKNYEQKMVLKEIKTESVPDGLAYSVAEIEFWDGDKNTDIAFQQVTNQSKKAGGWEITVSNFDLYNQAVKMTVKKEITQVVTTATGIEKYADSVVAATGVLECGDGKIACGIKFNDGSKVALGPVITDRNYIDQKVFLAAKVSKCDELSQCNILLTNIQKIDLVDASKKDRCNIGIGDEGRINVFSESDSNISELPSLCVELENCAWRPMGGKTKKYYACCPMNVSSLVNDANKDIYQKCIL